MWSGLMSYFVFPECTIKGVVEEVVVFGLIVRLFRVGGEGGNVHSRYSNIMVNDREHGTSFTLITPPPTNRYTSSSITLKIRLDSSSLVESFLRSNSDLPFKLLH